MTGEEWKIRGKLLQEVEALRDRIKRLEQDQGKKKDRPLELPDGQFGPTFDNVAEGVLLIDLKTKRPVAGNKAVCRMLGCRQEDIENLGLDDVYPQKTSTQIIEKVERQPDGKPSLASSFPVKKRDGGILFADVTLVPLTFTGQKYIMSVLRETSANKTGRTQPRNASADALKRSHLTATELNVLKLIVDGMSSKEIAHLLHRSPRTIENHRAHLMKKLGVDNSVELIRRAITIGLIDLPTKPQQENAH